MSNKLCPKCKVSLPVISFTKNNSKRDGLQSYCIDCAKKERLKHYRSNRKQYYDRNIKTKKMIREYIDSVKSAPCMDCGIKYIPPVMEFDHINPGNKSDDVAVLARSGSLDKVKEEIMKCELVCSNCHRIRTAIRSGWNIRKPTDGQSVSKTDQN